MNIKKFKKLKAEERRLAASIRVEEHRLAPRVASFLDKINRPDAARVRMPLGPLGLRLREVSAPSLNFMRQYVARLEDRLRAACADNGIAIVGQRLKGLSMPAAFRFAYFRDQFIINLHALATFEALRKNDRHELDRLAKLPEIYDRADKGPLRKSRAGVEALNMVRRWYAFRLLADHLRLSPKRRRKIDADLLEPFRTRPLDSGEGTEFLDQVLKAKKFRETRRPPRMTEEGDPRADLTAYGMICQLLKKEPEATKKQLREVFWPGYKGDMRNFGKLLDKCHVPWKRERPGRPKSCTRGQEEIHYSIRRA